MDQNEWLDLLEGHRTPDRFSQRTLLSLLRRLGTLYGGVMAWRATAYRRGWLTTCRPACPVISVGNLSWGGTGKTPMTRWLVEQLLAMGRRPGIVSRGYGQESRLPVTLVADRQRVLLTPPLAADEACWLAQVLPGVPVLTGRDRCSVIQSAIATHHCNAIVLDDGFQHLRVQRAVNLVLLDAERPFGNGAVIPGGILREPLTALDRCDAVVITRARDRAAVAPLVEQLQRLLGKRPILAATHQSGGFDPLGTQVAGGPEAGARVVAFCGIARPQAFYEACSQQGVQVVATRSFSDHHPFLPGELVDLSRLARQLQATHLVCTGKDAVKIDPAWSSLPIATLGMTIAFLEDPEPLLALVRTALQQGGRPPPHPLVAGRTPRVIERFSFSDRE